MEENKKENEILGKDLYVNSGYLFNTRVPFKEKKLPLRILSAGTYQLFTWPKLPTWRPKGRVDWQIIYIAAGEGHFILNGQEVVVPAGKKPHTVVYGADIKKDEYPAGTEVVQPEKKLEKVLAEPIHQDVKIGFELIPGTKTIVPAAASYTFKVDGSLAIPFSFPAGTKIYITRSFRDLGLNLGDYDIKADKFDIIGSITSTIPFDIACTGQDVNGVTAKTENPVKAGSTRNPVTSDVVIKVAGANAEKSIDEVQAVFELTATQGARLNKGQSLKINYDSIKVNI